MNKNVLIIEDNLSDILPVKAILESLNYKVETATDGQEGINRLTQKNYDLIILDWKMPDIDGNFTLEYAEKFNPNIKETPFIAYTGLKSSLIKIPQVEKFYLIDHWKKPFDFSTIENRLKIILQEIEDISLIAA